MLIRAGTCQVRADLIIFDKDGTLVDVHAPWGKWAEGVAVEVADYIPPDQLLSRIGWDRQARRIMPESPLAIASRAELSTVITTWLYEGGVGWSSASAIARNTVETVEVPPAPLLCDLRALFDQFAESRVHLAVVTTDTREGVERDLSGMGLLPHLKVIIGADSDIPTKPEPDAVLAVCTRTATPPGRTIVVGDSVADLLMGRAAGVALVAGVLSGAGTAEALQPHADVLLSSVCGLAPL